ncbi:hypothetical protein FC60_GL001458 [Limosilactobacillus gastricus DSM 16045]|uniref:Carboxymuconolactone decarboxylase-like domain-containing protein n=1 Tax=Limosilactobacillus gastricus DSM 16045 TaxID=1423749 RepID=A0A0R1VCG4_9LACO|nr:hypothetical protein FC60_GL001458 [Limosilactobacillus gastricus DSM 16045]
MAISSAASEYRQRLFADDPFQELAQKDPEVYEIVNNFMFDEVVNNDDLDDRTRFMCNLATLIGCQGIDLFSEYVPAALKAGVSPVEVKELTYQAIDYLGMGRVYPFLKVVNQQLAAQGIDLPLPGQSTTSPETRLAAGSNAKSIFLAKECATLRVRVVLPKISTNGWLIIALGITTHVRV